MEPNFVPVKIQVHLKFGFSGSNEPRKTRSKYWAPAETDYDHQYLD